MKKGTIILIAVAVLIVVLPISLSAQEKYADFKALLGNDRRYE